MILNELIDILKDKEVFGDHEIDITGIAYNSNLVQPGNLFVAIPGFVTNGHKYVNEAIGKGAKAVVSEKRVETPGHVSNIIVPEARRVMAELANNFYGYPSRKLKVIGITGTNGKTTICHILESILRYAGYKVGLIGTIEARVNDKIIPSKLTTPESVDLQNILNVMVEEGVTHVLMEVSSHSLALDRVYGTEFDLGIYTNLTHDHLDFHKTMEDYFNAKLKLFKSLSAGAKKGALGLVNKDDAHSGKVLDAVKGKGLTYGLDYSSNLSAKDVKFGLDKVSFKVATESEFIELSSKLIGLPNVYNILASILCGLSLGLDLIDIKDAIERIDGVPGRFERVRAGQDFEVIVDFAHSPDSLQKLIKTYRPFAKGRILLVFGCPGDRDKTKRPMMGEIAARLSDYTIITTDDPHAEDPVKIINEIEKGFLNFKFQISNFEKIVDRRKAIEKVLSLAKKDDIVLIAGRGHEKFQDFAGENIEIDDREVVKSFFKR